MAAAVHVLEGRSGIGRRFALVHAIDHELDAMPLLHTQGGLHPYLHGYIALVVANGGFRGGLGHHEAVVAGIRGFFVLIGRRLDGR